LKSVWIQGMVALGMAFSSAFGRPQHGAKRFSAAFRGQIHCIAEPYKQATELMIRERNETKKLNNK
jgi:hypothetical protein